MTSGSTFEPLWASLLAVGRDPATGGYRRLAWSDTDLEARAWFVQRASERGLEVEVDRNGNLWAWWSAGADRQKDAVCVGSHLDSVWDGGAFDGALGVVSGLAAVDLLRSQGFRPHRPVAVVVFADEEGSRFGAPCVGSRLMVGAIEAGPTRRLTDPHGVTVEHAMRAAGVDPSGLGCDRERLSRIGAFVELHVEQGRRLVNDSAALGLAASIWPHGRWRIVFEGQANHAGTTSVSDRRDPMLSLAVLIGEAHAAAGPDARLTIGRVKVEPNGSNSIPARVTAWLDARGADDAILEGSVARVRRRLREAAEDHRVVVSWRPESRSPGVTFPEPLRRRIGSRLHRAGGRPIPVLPTAAGHDAGVLAGTVPSAMLFVRNPTGISHSPAEHADLEDCRAGVAALAAIIEELA